MAPFDYNNYATNRGLGIMEGVKMKKKLWSYYWNTKKKRKKTE